MLALLDMCNAIESGAALNPRVSKRKVLGIDIDIRAHMAILDMVGVASIMPFMAVLANPDLVESNAFLSAAYTQLGFTDPQQFLFALGMLVYVLLVVSLAFKAPTTYAQLRFTLMCEYSISKRMVEGCLHQPYSWFLSRHSVDLAKPYFRKPARLSMVA